MQRITEWFAVKILQPAKTLSPQEIGLATAVGLYGGIFPLPMVSTGATLAMCYGPFKSRYNPAMLSITIATSAIATPLQLLCMPVFMNLPYNITTLPATQSFIDSISPEWNNIIASKVQQCNVSDFLESVKTLPLPETFMKFGSCMVWSTVSWLLLAPIAIVLTRMIVARGARRFITPKKASE